MLNQRRFEEPPMAIGEKKQVVVLKLDCSGSMSYDEKIKKLNEAVNKMLEKCRADDLVSKNVEFIIIIYNSDAEVIQPAAPAAKCMNVSLTASGETNARAAHFLSMKEVTKRSKVHESLGCTTYTPLVFDFTDGVPFINGHRQIMLDTELDIRKAVNENKARFFAFGVEGADFDALEKLYGEDYVFELENYDFEGIFDWMFKTIRAITRTSPGEDIEVEALPDTVLDAEERQEKKRKKLMGLFNS